MVHPQPPLIGAALTVDTLAAHREWLLADQRDLELQDFVSPTVLDSEWRPLVRRARDLLDGYTGRLGIHGPMLEITSDDPAIRAVVMRRFRQGLEICAELGAGHMVIHSSLFYHGHPLVEYAADDRLATLIGYAYATLAEVVPLAQQAQCTLVIENIFDLNPAPLLAVVRSFESDYVRMSLDTGHAFLAQHHGGPPPDQWVREAGSLLGHLHVHDTDGNADRHWAPGDGNINWYALFEALGASTHQPRMVLEVTPEQLTRGFDWLVRQGFVR
ncbi:MAG: sugar phosphate isomerase/epimerase [Blastochloris sp.]|nr:sugar phosphate isomerase/epimerase [Blastochloris sp.]